VHTSASSRLRSSMRCVAVLVGCIGVVSAQSISVTNLAGGQSISGTAFVFTVSYSNLPSVESVEYDVNGEIACIARSAPWSCTWNTYYSYGGPSQSVVAIARDALHRTLATSGAVSFTIQNVLPAPASVLTWTVAAPSSPWSGTISIVPSCSGTDISASYVMTF